MPDALGECSSFAIFSVIVPVEAEASEGISSRERKGGSVKK